VEISPPVAEEMREYRRRDLRSVKKEFQSITAVDAGGFAVPAEVAGVGSAVVDALRTRQREGVKNEDGLEVAVAGLAAKTENLDLVRQGRAVAMMVVDERLRFEGVVDAVKKLVEQLTAGR
jgi:hypothetical protein